MGGYAKKKKKNAQNNPYAEEACFGVAYSLPLQSP